MANKLAPWKPERARPMTSGWNVWNTATGHPLKDTLGRLVHFRSAAGAQARADRLNRLARTRPDPDPDAN